MGKTQSEHDEREARIQRPKKAGCRRSPVVQPQRADRLTANYLAFYIRLKIRIESTN
jgi:hypothetical protein